MHRNRPKRVRTDPNSHARLRRRWRSWLPTMNADLAHLLGKREIFWDLQKIARENRRILEHGAFFDWMCTNYIAAVTMGVRSFTDQSTNVHSLWRLLYEALENPGVLSRRAHQALYRRTSRSSRSTRSTRSKILKIHKIQDPRSSRSTRSKIQDQDPRSKIQDPKIQDPRSGDRLRNP